MRVVIQRCRQARVEIDGKIVGQIQKGLAVFVGVGQSDDESVAEKLASKIVGLRIFDDGDGKFNFSVRDVGGGVLVISNFTLLGDARKGTRPSFSKAAPPELANRLYQLFVRLLCDQGIEVATGNFGAEMAVFVENDGPVTLVLDEISPQATTNT